jgi:hypothetical protein
MRRPVPDTSAGRCLSVGCRVAGNAELSRVHRSGASLNLNLNFEIPLDLSNIQYEINSNML